MTEAVENSTKNQIYCELPSSGIRVNQKQGCFEVCRMIVFVSGGLAI